MLVCVCVCLFVCVWIYISIFWRFPFFVLFVVCCRMRPFVSYLRRTPDLDVNGAESRAYIMAITERLKSMQLAKEHVEFWEWELIKLKLKSRSCGGKDERWKWRLLKWRLLLLSIHWSNDIIRIQLFTHSVFTERNYLCPPQHRLHPPRRRNLFCPWFPLSSQPFVLRLLCVAWPFPTTTL